MKEMKAAWQWASGEKAYRDNEYQKAAELFAQSAKSFPDWGMTHFWRLRAAIQTRDLKQAQLHLVKCRETLPQLEEALNRWETLLEQLFNNNKKQITDELAELDTYTDEQLQNKWEKPQWSWKNVGSVAILPQVTYVVVVAVIEAIVSALFHINLDLIIENILFLPLLWWWWNSRRKRVPYPEPFMVWFFRGVRICIGICKHSRPFYIYLACYIIFTVLYLIVFTDSGMRENGPPKRLISDLMQIVITGPLMEEIMFRETLFSFFREKWNRVTTYLLISILFTLIHIRYITDCNLRAVMSVFILSIIYIWFYEKYRHVFAPTLIHAVGNGSNMLAEMTLLYLMHFKV